MTDRCKRTTESFMVQIRFQQHESWQGTVQWLGKRRQVDFRSAMELLYILNSALQASGDEEMSQEDREIVYLHRNEVDR